MQTSRELRGRNRAGAHLRLPAATCRPCVTAGLARGGTLHNAVVLDEAGIASGPLRFRDEFVRHKILDLLGDLALLGSPLQGKIHAGARGTLSTSIRPRAGAAPAGNARHRRRPRPASRTLSASFLTSLR